MEIYLQVFVNFEQDDWARLLQMAKFTYNYLKNTSIGHTLLKPNYSFYPQLSYEEDVNSYSQSKLAAKLATKLRELMAVCKEKLKHI